MTAGLCAFWLVAVALIVLWPTPVDRAGGDGLREALRYLYARGLPTAVTYGAVEFTSNVVMFLPFGLFWFILTPRVWRWMAAVAGMGLSIMIELAQLILLPQRVATPYDVLANTIGALTGCTVAWLLLHMKHSP